MSANSRAQRAPNREPGREAHAGPSSRRRAQLKEDLAGLPYEQQAERLRPPAPLQFAVQMQELDEEPLDLSAVPAGPARDAANELAASDEEVERNTAEAMSIGAIDVYYIELLDQPDNEVELLQGWGYDPADYSVYLHPETGEEILVQAGFPGFWRRGTDDIFGWYMDTVEDWKLTMVHETNHALNTPPTTPVERYLAEFRAYWVSDFRDVEDLDERALAIKDAILDFYPMISAPYRAYPRVRREIDAITRPDGNVTNDVMLPDWDLAG